MKKYFKIYVALTVGILFSVVAPNNPVNAQSISSYINNYQEIIRLQAEIAQLTLQLQRETNQQRRLEAQNKIQSNQARILALSGA